MSRRPGACDARKRSVTLLTMSDCKVLRDKEILVVTFSRRRSLNCRPGAAGPLISGDLKVEANVQTRIVDRSDVGIVSDFVSQDRGHIRSMERFQPALA